jgi:hypothetical protein
LNQKLLTKFIALMDRKKKERDNQEDIITKSS